MEMRFRPLIISVRLDRGTNIAALAAAREMPLASSSSTSREMAGFVMSIFMVVQCVSSIFTNSTLVNSSFSHSKVIRHGDLRESASMEYRPFPRR